MAGAVGFGELKPADAEALTSLFAAGFGFGAGLAREVVRRLGPAAFRVVTEDAIPVATAARLDFDQYFGGRPLRCLGVLLVAVDPLRRGRGLGRHLLAELLAEAREQGYALSALYSATLPVYAGLGYAAAGSKFRYRAPLAKTLGGLRPPPTGVNQIVLLAPEDRAVLGDLRRRQAITTNGLIDRPAALWSMVLDPAEDPQPAVYRLDGREGPEGYLVIRPPAAGQLSIIDYCVLNRDAGLKLLDFVRGFRAQADSVDWPGGPEDPLVQLLPETGVESADWDQWQVRVLDVEAALVGRGYPAGLNATLTLEVEDSLFAENNGRFHLKVSAGGSSITRDTGGDALALEIGGLAPLLTGHLSPAALRNAGRLHGSETALAAATVVFAGPRPWLAEEF